MAGAPPFADGRLVTLENWLLPPFNRWAFQHVRELIPTARIARGDGPVWELPRAERDDLDGLRFAVRPSELAPDGTLTVRELLDRTCTDGFLVIHRGRVVTERYFNGLRPDVPHLLMSVSKSVTGLAAGVLASQGKLDVTVPVESIVPELTGTSFEGATVQQLLDMRTGTKYREDYEDPHAEIAVSDRVYGWAPDDGKPRAADAVEYFATLVNDGPHGGPFRYRSILTDVLGLVLEKAAGQRFSNLVAGELWQPMGAEHDADITLDAHGNALADGGISATLRDAGRIGLLALNRGNAAGRQVIAPEWFDDLVTGAPDGPEAFRQGDGAGPGYPDGAHYRNCWWITDPGLPMYSAAGIYGQSVFVHGPSQVVVAKLSSWPAALSTPMRRATIAAVTAIASALSDG
jgi:CubicO group peptidase (beta-lactamase class C family)